MAIAVPTIASPFGIPPIITILRRILFILRQRVTYWGLDERSALAATVGSSGLGNSVQFLVDMLPGIGIDAKSIEIVDNNAIDAEVSGYQPTHAIVEALWCVPEKFDVLKKLHPRVQWIVRLHSEMPFMANEGIAIQWIAGYLKRGVEVMCNSTTMQADLQTLAVDLGQSETLITYGPNFYPFQASVPAEIAPRAPFTPGEMHVGCFGAIRPLKNHLAQAIAAISAANAARVKLRFHVNGGRVEGGAAPILKNLQSLFANSAGGKHKLVMHDWLSRSDFLNLLSTMDIAMQVSYSETFNIVAADAAAVGIPVICSAAVPWVGSYAQSDPNDIHAMASCLRALYAADTRQRIAQQGNDLRNWSSTAQNTWHSRFSA